MDEGTLAVHEIKFVVDPGENFRNGCAVRYHAASAHNLSKVTTWDNRRRLIIDAALKTRRAPINKLDRTLRLDCGNCCIHVFGHDVSSVHHTTCHVLTMAGVALDKHGCRFEDAHRDLSHRQLLVVG